MTNGIAAAAVERKNWLFAGVRTTCERYLCLRPLLRTQTLVASWLGVAVGPVEPWRVSVVPARTHCVLGA
eukprot:3717026-Lingulodinium_polyedra.AAC.1